MAVAYNKRFRELVLREFARLGCTAEVASKFGIGSEICAKVVKTTKIKHGSHAAKEKKWPT